MINSDPATWLHAQADDAQVSWSVGTFGALAEFMRGPDEAADVRHEDGTTTIATARGALRFSAPQTARLIAYEGLSKLPGLWSHGVSLCLPVADVALGGRERLTRLGPDRGAVPDACRDDTLVDLGVGAVHIDACVRTGDPELLAAIEPHLGTPLFAPDSDAPCRLQAASPHRVFRSTAARIEVYGSIPDADAVTESGPHSHLLPDLLARKQAFAATLPIPDGWLPVLNLYPPNPCRDGRGDPRGFDRTAHEAFQQAYAAFAPDGLVEIKRRVTDAVRRGEASPERGWPQGRHERTAARVALRQLCLTDGPSETLSRWQAALEPNAGDGDQS